MTDELTASLNAETTPISKMFLKFLILRFIKLYITSFAFQSYFHRILWLFENTNSNRRLQHFQDVQVLFMTDVSSYITHHIKLWIRSNLVKISQTPDFESTFWFRCHEWFHRFLIRITHCYLIWILFFTYCNEDFFISF